MEEIRVLILSAALLALVGVSGLIFTGNFVDTSTLFSNFGLILVAIIFLIIATYILYKKDISLRLKSLFIQKSDEATLAFVRNELMNIKNEINKIKRVTRTNANKLHKELKTHFEKLLPYKIYVSMFSKEVLDAMNKILSYEKVTSKNFSEFSLLIKKLKKELTEI